MNRLATAFACLILAVVPSLADEPAPDLEELQNVSEKARPLRDKWERCTALAVRSGLRSRAEPESLAGTALARCKPEEARLAAFLGKQVGPRTAKRTMAQLRDLQRSNLILVIETLRDAPK
jgi:hypothetical protein